MASKHIRQAACKARLEGHAWRDLRRHHASILPVGRSWRARLGHDVKTLSTDAHVIRNDDERLRTISTSRSALQLRLGLRTKAV